MLKEGERMLLVRNVMTQDVKTVSPEMDAFDVAGVMRSHDVGSAPVVDGDGHLVGIVTDRDLVIRVLGDRADPKGVRVGDVATRRSIFTIGPDAQVSEARALMAAERIRRLPVVKGDRLVGIVSLGDVAEADSSARAVGEALKEISESPATLERALRPDPGTPDRVMKHRS
jgi:CBS domain-containing protein